MPFIVVRLGRLCASHSTTRQRSISSGLNHQVGAVDCTFRRLLTRVFSAQDSLADRCSNSECALARSSMGVATQGEAVSGVNHLADQMQTSGALI